MDKGPGEFVTHNEFSAFERQVTRRFDEQATVLSSLSAKLDQISSRGTDWKAIFGGLSLASTIILAIGSLFGWGLSNRIDTIASIVSKNRDELIETAVESAGRNSAQDLQIKANETAALALDEALQREMRLLDDRLQTEMRLLDEHTKESADLRFLRTDARLNKLENLALKSSEEIAKRTTIVEIVRRLDLAFSQLEGRLRAIETTRATAEDKAAVERRIASLEAYRAEYSRLMDDMQAELVRRAPHVFGDGESP